jgi:hypothetical protein
VRSLTAADSATFADRFRRAAVVLARLDHAARPRSTTSASATDSTPMLELVDDSIDRDNSARSLAPHPEMQ